MPQFPIPPPQGRGTKMSLIESEGLETSQKGTSLICLEKSLKYDTPF